MHLAAPRVYDALSDLGEASEPQLRAATGICKSVMNRAMRQLLADGTIIASGTRKARGCRPSTYYRVVAAGAVRPSEVPKSTGFQRMAIAREALVDCNLPPVGIVESALAAARVDPLACWARGDVISVQQQEESV